MPSLSQLVGKHEFSMIGIKEQELFEIANTIGSNYTTMMKLGFDLGFEKGTIDQYVASNHQGGMVSLQGITNMMFAWKRKTSPANQIRILRGALIEAQLIEIADTYLPQSETVTRPERSFAILKTSATQTAGLNTGTAKTGQEQSVELLCLKCNRVTAEITNVINTKRSEMAKSSKVRNIMGRECLMQLMEGTINKILAGRYDVITLTSADVKLGDKVFPGSAYDGYKEHRATRCTGCSQQVGWYDTPTDCNSAPFHGLWLQRLIHDTYDSDNSLNAFFAGNRIEE